MLAGFLQLPLTSAQTGHQAMGGRVNGVLGEGHLQGADGFHGAAEAGEGVGAGVMGLGQRVHHAGGGDGLSEGLLMLTAAAVHPGEAEVVGGVDRIDGADGGVLPLGLLQLAKGQVAFGDLLMQARAVVDLHATGLLEAGDRLLVAAEAGEHPAAQEGQGVGVDRRAPPQSRPLP